MKRAVVITLIGVAFVGVSLWLFLSGGRSARATRLKYRLGGAILSLTALASTSCENFVTSCYDPVVYPSYEVSWDEENGVELRNGDVVLLDVACIEGHDAVMDISISTSDSATLQTQNYELTPETTQVSLTIDVGDYLGEAHIYWFVEGFRSSMKVTIVE